MAENTETGTISIPFVNTRSVLWKLSFCINSQIYSLKSPPFDFAGASWCFLLNTREDPFNSFSSDKEFYFSLLLERLDSSIPHHRISYQATLKCLEDHSKNHTSSAYRYFSLEKFDEDHRKHRMDISYHQWKTFEFESVRKHNSFKMSTRYFLELFCILFNEDLEKKKPDLRNFDPALQLKHYGSDTGLNLLSQDMKEVLLNGQDYDVTLGVKGKTFRAHKDILRARSQIFHSMLSHDMLEKNRGAIEVPDCDPEAFGQFLYYVYTGEVKELNENNMLGLYYIADKYNLAHLKEECSEFIKKSISVTNICLVIQLAMNHSDASLLESVTRYFTNNVSDIVPTVAWQSFIKQNPAQVNELIIKSVTKLKDIKL